MKKKTVSALLSMLLLLSISTLAFNVQLVRAEPKTWYVDDDGGADFTRIQDAIDAAGPGDIIFVYNGVYYENLRVNKENLRIMAESKSDTIIDGGRQLVIYINRNKVSLSGFTVRNGGLSQHWGSGSAILLRYARYCSISDNTVSTSRYGITSYVARHNIISGNTIFDTNQGIPLAYSYNETAIGNSISNGVQYGSDPPYGIQVWGGYNNTVVSNVATNISYTGIRLSYTTRNVVSGNNVSNTSVGIAAEFTSSFNTISGNNGSNNEIGIEVYGQSNNNILTSNNVSNNNFGIRLGSSLNTIVSQNNVTSNEYGIDISDSSNGNHVAGNNITNNIYGVMLSHSSGNNVLANDMTSNHAGIYLGLSSDNNITENKITNNGNGIMFAESSQNSIVRNSIVANNYDGIWFVYSSNNNNIAGNNIVANNRHGIWVWDSSNNRIFHNNFINNAPQAFSELANVWDDGYPSGGNYWSGYIDVDLGNGPNQDLPGMDGIWDHPYFIDEDNRDRYPLVKPYPTIPVAVDIDPDTLHLMSKGQWITCYIELPEGYNVSNIDVHSVMLDDTIPVSLLDVPAPHPVPTEIGDYDNDGVPDLMVKFDRAIVAEYILSKRIVNDYITLTITGEVDGVPFEGEDTIRVLMTGGGTRGHK